MSEINIKFGENQRAIPSPATVADAIKAFDRDALKKSLAAKVNGEEVDLNKELTVSDEVISIQPILADTRDGLEVIRHSTAHLLAAAMRCWSRLSRWSVRRVMGIVSTTKQRARPVNDDRLNFDPA